MLGTTKVLGGHHKDAQDLQQLQEYKTFLTSLANSKFA